MNSNIFLQHKLQFFFLSSTYFSEKFHYIYGHSTLQQHSKLYTTECGLKSFSIKYPNKSKFVRMGSATSTETKTADNAGTVNNNLILAAGERPNVMCAELIVLLGILVILRIIEFAYFIYRAHKRSLKRKYFNNSITQA